MKRILLLLGSCFACSCFIFSQEVVSPKLVSVESNGVKTYSAEGFESQSASENTSNESLERPVRTMNDYSLEEIDNQLYSVDLKLEHVKASQNQYAIDEYEKIKTQLLERRKELTVNH